MKISLVLTTIAVLATKVSAKCFAEDLGYRCCYGDTVLFSDESGDWGIEQGDWCGIATDGSANQCWANKLGYACCKTASDIVETDSDGKWSIENDEWCGIDGDNNTPPAPEPQSAPQPEPQPEPQQSAPQSEPQPEPQPEPQASAGEPGKYEKNNAPVPSKGCGSELKLPKTDSFEFQWSGGTRTVRIDIPDNYDNTHPYRLVFGMHCMGGWAGGVQQEGYYGMKPLDTEKTTIFIAPEGNGQQAPWGEGDYTLFDELLDKLKNELCIDESRVFSSGFSYGSMFSNGLSWNHQKVLRAVAVYEVAERNIWLPQHTGEPIAWMGVLGLDDGLCTPEMGRSARDIILEHNSEGGKAKNEQCQEAAPGGPHTCYDYKDVDPRYPVRWCTQSGGHIWDHKDPGQFQSWVPETTWDFFTQF